MTISLGPAELSSSMDKPSDMTSTSLRFTSIVAVTPSLGIGRNGTLPWPRIKSEMAYFARVTKRAPTNKPGALNAVIMGRRTWESIPAKFRPLPDRLNVVISRKPEDLRFAVSNGSAEAPLAASSLREALDLLQKKEWSPIIGRVFVIGGGQVYGEAATMAEAERVLLTRIKDDYECDTFFPLKLGSTEDQATEWKLATDKARDEWLGEQNFGGNEWTVEMWERTATVS